MAAKKKVKKKTKAKTKPKKRVAKKKTVARKKPAKKKVAAKRPAAKKKPVAKAKPAAARAPVLKPVKPAAAAAPAGQRVGVVTHYFNHLSVAIIKMESGMLREGDMVHIKGHTSDFKQRVQSMELDHVHVPEVWPGQSFGLKVSEHAREHDVVYKIPS
ncbi:MAG: hypothetical protein JSW09_09190 [Pseudomonadota bacterium]|nr:MAG: hypothetical protein JSW09_09190 [Pseudomonadota bacterium]